MLKTDDSIGELQSKLETKGAVFEADLTKLVASLMEYLYAQTR